MKRSYPTFRYYYNNPEGLETLPVSSGGTGIDTYVPGDILVADSNESLTVVNSASDGNAFVSRGVGLLPEWGKIDLTQHTSGVVPLERGGTGVSVPLQDGQITIGSTGASPVVANVQGGPGIDVTNGPGSITVGLTGGSGAGDGEIVIGQTGGDGVLATIQPGPGVDVTNGPGSITVGLTPVPDPITYSSSLIDFITGSLVDVVMPGMSVVPGEGSYIVFFAGTYETGSDNTEITVTIYRAGVPIVESEAQHKKELKRHMGAIAYVSGLLDGEEIDVRIRVSENQVIFYQRQIIVQRVS